MTATLYAFGQMPLIARKSGKSERWAAQGISLVACCLIGLLPQAHSQVTSLADRANHLTVPDAPSPSYRLGLQATGHQAEAQQPEAQQPEVLTGTIDGDAVDPNGNYLVAAHVRLVHEGSPLVEETSPDAEGHFSFKGVAPGAFVVTITAQGFSPRELSGDLKPGEALVLPRVILSIAAATTEVQVRVTNYELAEEELKIEETQRVFGVIPNFYVTYQPNALALKPRQKFELAWKNSIDPVSFAASGVFAGVEQAQNDFKGYGQGSQGYAKRFGAAYADGFIGGMIGGAILPSLFKQDPRYFYKGTGTIRSRVLYALANSVICKGDNGRWQMDYSGIVGSLAAAGISNIYYPASSRNGAGLTFENTLIGIGGSGIGNLFQEFLVRKLTPHARHQP